MTVVYLILNNTTYIMRGIHAAISRATNKLCILNVIFLAASIVTVPSNYQKVQKYFCNDGGNYCQVIMTIITVICLLLQLLKRAQVTSMI